MRRKLIIWIIGILTFYGWLLLLPLPWQIMMIAILPIGIAYPILTKCVDTMRNIFFRFVVFFYNVFLRLFIEFLFKTDKEDLAFGAILIGLSTSLICLIIWQKGFEEMISRRKAQIC